MRSGNPSVVVNSAVIQRIAYFLRETLNAVLARPGTNAASVLSIALVLALFGAAVGASWNARHMIEALSSQAQLAVFFEEGARPDEVTAIISALRSLPGVSAARLVSEEEALQEMMSLLGKDDRNVLAAFEGYNPFSAYIEVTVPPASARQVAAAARGIPGVEYVRDNQEVISALQRLQRLTAQVSGAVGAAAAVTSALVVSHIVLLGIQARKEEIEVMRLLGASELFVAAPSVLEGLLLGMLGALLAWGIHAYLWSKAYAWVSSVNPFVPLLPKTRLLTRLLAALCVLGTLSAITGSIFALRRHRDKP